MSNIIDDAMTSEKMKQMKSGGKKKKQIIGVEKLVDANEAGGRNSEKCILLIKEGQAEKSL